MQINTLPTIVLPVQTQRPDVSDRLQRDAPRDARENSQTRENEAQARSLEERRQQAADVPIQRIETLAANSAVTARQQADGGLPLNTRRALQAFAENSPSAEQRLGIELAGIDTFA